MERGRLGSHQHAIERSEGGAKRIVGNPVSGPGGDGAPERRSAWTSWAGASAATSTDKLVHDVEDRPPPALFACASRAGRGDLIRKLVNISGVWRGPPASPSRARRVVPG